MGRRAKTFTLDEKKAQAQARQHDRRQTTQYVSFCYTFEYNFNEHHMSSSKALISAQRCVAYWQTRGRQGSTRLRLPKNLVALAIQELPIHSHLFRAASESEQLLDETGLDDWNGGPPYVTGPPSDTPREVQFTERMKEVVHGRRVRLQNEEEEIWQRSSTSDLRRLLEAAVEEWKIGCQFLTEYEDGHREGVMAELWLQWVARRAYGLHSEISYYRIS
jgi:hypothetical protein